MLRHVQMLPAFCLLGRQCNVGLELIFSFWANRPFKHHPLQGLLAVKREQWPGLGRIPACLSCWPQFFHAVINPADNAALQALFLRTHSTLPHILMAWQRPSPQSPLCLKQSTLPGWGPQLVHILVKCSASLTTITDIWGCVCVRCPGPRFHKAIYSCVFNIAIYIPNTQW